MLIVFIVLAAVGTVVIGLVVVGREVALGASRARPAVFDLEEAVAFIAEGLPEGTAARLTYDDVRWVLRTDADQLEAVTDDADHLELGSAILEEGPSLARVLGAADREHMEMSDADIAAVIEGRTRYLRAIGAIGPEAHDLS